MAYLDMSSAFVYKKALFQSKLEQLADNDIFLNARALDDGAKLAFTQATVPIGYTLDVSNNGKLLRVVSGAGGGSGGSHDVASVIPANHTSHSIGTSEQHNHDGGGHEHELDEAALGLTLTSGGSNDYIIRGGGGPNSVMPDTGATVRATLIAGETDPQTTGVFANNVAQDHGGATLGSALTDIAYRYLDSIIGIKDAATIPFTNQSSTFTHNKKIDFEDFDSGLADNDARFQEKLIPETSIAIFTNSSVPVGWTSVLTEQTRGLRVVSGVGGGVGGSLDIATTNSLGHSHTTSTDVDHDHDINNHFHDWNLGSASDTAGSPSGDRVALSGGFLRRFVAGVGITIQAIRDFTKTDGGGGNTGSSGSHAHTISSALSDYQLATMNVIRGSKDAAGAPFPYVDQTTEFVFKRLVSEQRLNTLGKNDEHIKFHQTPSGTEMFFFQAAAPSGWTQIVTNNDLALRTFSAGGGIPSGSPTPVSTAIPLEHPHTIQNGGSHSHSIPDHTHTAETASSGPHVATPTEYVEKFSAANIPLRCRTTAAGIDDAAINTFTSVGGATTNTLEHNHSGATGDLLSDISLAFIDVIQCSKN